MLKSLESLNPGMKLKENPFENVPTMDMSIVQQKINSIFSFFGVVFTLGFAAFYFTLFNSYRKTVEKHDFLTEILNNPNARVASGEKAVQISQTILENQPTQVQTPTI